MHSRIAERISRLPQDYNVGDSSTATLIKTSGLLDEQEKLPLDELEEIFHEQPNLADDLLARWNDQRISRGWVMECEGSRYRIKNFATGRNLLIADKARACAEFAARYVALVSDVIRKYDT